MSKNNKKEYVDEDAHVVNRQHVMNQNLAEFVASLESLLGQVIDQEELYIYELQNDYEHYQRQLVPATVRLHEQDGVHANWIGLAAERDDGSLFIINGQHHVAAVKRDQDDAREYLNFYKFSSEGWQTEKMVFNLFQKFQQQNG